MYSRPLRIDKIDTFQSIDWISNRVVNAKSREYIALSEEHLKRGEEASLSSGESLLQLAWRWYPTQRGPRV